MTDSTSESLPQHHVYALWGAHDLGDLPARVDAPVQVNVSDDAVGEAFRITHFGAPVDAFVTVPADTDLAGVLEDFCTRYAGWRVETAYPIEPPASAPGERADALANIAVLRRPSALPYDAWLRTWKDEHTPVAIADQGNFGYVQHRVLAPLGDAPRVDAIVEELFPMAAVSDIHAFYGTGGDDAELSARMGRMLDSIARFGADRNLDLVPTSRYVYA